MVYILPCSIIIVDEQLQFAATASTKNLHYLFSNARPAVEQKRIPLVKYTKSGKFETISYNYSQSTLDLSIAYILAPPDLIPCALYLARPRASSRLSSARSRNGSTVPELPKWD